MLHVFSARRTGEALCAPHRWASGNNEPMWMWKKESKGNISWIVSGYYHPCWASTNPAYTHTQKICIIDWNNSGLAHSWSASQIQVLSQKHIFLWPGYSVRVSPRRAPTGMRPSIGINDLSRAYFPIQLSKCQFYIERDCKCDNVVFAGVQCSHAFAVLDACSTQTKIGCHKASWGKTQHALCRAMR